VIDARAQAADFDPGRQLARLAELGAPCIASFTASAVAEGDVTQLVVDHYPALAKNELARIAAEAAERWSLEGLILIHRHGRIAPGERLAFAAVGCGAHEAALEACGFLAEALRTRAPFWRKEVLADGSERWR
jgi:molybdopterin synthase catalytic subunit